MQNPFADDIRKMQERGQRSVARGEKVDQRANLSAAAAGELVAGGLSVLGRGIDFGNNQRAAEQIRQWQGDAINSAARSVDTIREAGTGIANQYRNAATKIVDDAYNGPQGIRTLADNWRTDLWAQTQARQAGQGAYQAADGSTRSTMGMMEYAALDQGQQAQRELAQGAQQARGQNTKEFRQQQAELQRQEAIALNEQRQIFQQTQATITDSISAAMRSMKDLTADFNKTLNSLGGGIEDVKASLDSGVWAQVATATQASITQKQQALADFESSWQGPRDQRYQQQKRAIAAQFDRPVQQATMEARQKYDELRANKLTELHTALDATRGSVFGAYANAQTGGLQALGYQSSALASAQGNYAQFQDGSRDRLATQRRDFLNAQFGVNQSYFQASGELTNNVYQNALNGLAADQQALYTTFQDQAKITEAQKVDNLAIEGNYASSLYQTMMDMNGNYMAAVGMLYNRTYDVPQLAGVFDQFYTVATNQNNRHIDQLRYDDAQSRADTALGLGFFNAGVNALGGDGLFGSGGIFGRGSSLFGSGGAAGAATQAVV